MERISGKSIQQLATEYRLPPRDVETQSVEAWETEVVESLKTQMLERLGTMVLAVYETQLRLGSLDAARDVALSIGLLRKPGTTLTVKPPVQAARAINSVEDYRLSRQSRKYRPSEIQEDDVPAMTKRRIDVVP